MAAKRYPAKASRKLSRKERDAIALALRVHRGVGYPEGLFKTLSAEPSHPCMSAFWGLVGKELRARITQLQTIHGPGFACTMVPATYWLLCAVKTEIERAVGAPQVPPAPHQGGDLQDALLHTRAQLFLSALAEDEFDGGPRHHTIHASAWMRDTGTAEAGAVSFLFVPSAARGHAATGHLLGKVRSALGT